MWLCLREYTCFCQWGVSVIGVGTVGNEDQCFPGVHLIYLLGILFRAGEIPVTHAINSRYASF